MSDEYDLFISYSRTADGALAASLQRELERFAKPVFARRGMRVFRDDANLSANPALWGSIRESLDAARYLLVLASPEAAASPWVKQEIEIICDFLARQFRCSSFRVDLLPCDHARCTPRGTGSRPTLRAIPERTGCAFQA